MDYRFKEFQVWLHSDLTHFVALVEEGSTVAGDPIQPAFNDHDITIIVSQDVDSDMQAVFRWLEKHPFDDTYLFEPRLANEFLLGDSLNDISFSESPSPRKKNRNSLLIQLSPLSGRFESYPY